jgi:hypothetical protein
VEDQVPYFLSYKIKGYIEFKCENYTDAYIHNKQMINAAKMPKCLNWYHLMLSELKVRKKNG